MSLKQKLQNRLYIVIAAALVFTALIPILDTGVAHALVYGLVTTRSIKMSDSTASGTNVIYTLAYTTATTSNVGGVVVDFCSNDPIIGDSCTAPAGLNTNEATLVLANQVGITGLSVDTGHSTASTLILTRTASSINSATSVSIDLGTAANGISNPSSTNATFYARVYTFDTIAHTQAYTATGANTGLVDAGGIALSTANNIVITAKVQEQITFCVDTNNAGTCGSASGSTVTLGDTHGVLSTLGPFVDKNTEFIIATNAQSGAIIRLKGNTLQSGANSIAAIGSTAVVSSPGTSQFGLCEYESSGANLTVTGLYNGNNGGAPGTLCSGTSQTAGTGSTGGDNSAKFAFDSANTNTTYGQQIASETAGTQSIATLPFIGNISSGQQAGIYTTTLIFIATGTY